MQAVAHMYWKDAITTTETLGNDSGTLVHHELLKKIALMVKLLTELLLQLSENGFVKRQE